MGSTGGSRSPREPVPSHERAGTVLAGKYRVERVLGRGGMGLVVACRHLRLRQTVALKLLLPSTGRPEATSRFLREARAAAALRSDRVARVFDVDTLEDGTGYIVMEYLEGQTLAALLQKEGRLDPRRTVDCALQACEALSEAHALGIVHRDLKPSNLFLAKRRAQPEALCVLDFGISKAFERASDEPTTESHAFVGSPPYASPEQLVSPRSVGAWSDIWCLGIVLFECLSGGVPFKGDTLASLWNSILRDELPPFPPDSKLDPALMAAVRRCLEKSADDRYPDVLALARDLVPFGSTRARFSLEVIEANASGTADQSGVPPSGSPNDAALGADTTLTEAPIVQDFGRENASRRRWLNPLLAVVAATAAIVALPLFIGRQAEKPKVAGPDPAAANTPALIRSLAEVEAPKSTPPDRTPSAETKTEVSTAVLPSKVAGPAKTPRRNLPSEGGPRRVAQVDAPPATAAERATDSERPGSERLAPPPARSAAPAPSTPEIDETGVYADRE